MSKRFIDTGLFDDDWFMNLSKDAKLLWIYFITKCDHAGIIKLNFKLCKVQTDIRDLSEIIKQLDNRLVTVSEHLYFIPKYIEFQYPNFPNSKVRQQSSAIDILLKYNLLDKENLTVSKELVNTYVNDTVNDNVNVNVNVKKAEFDFLFLDETWKELFLEWIEYKKSIKDNYTTQKSIEACYRNLKTLSSNNLTIAKRIVDQSIGNKYKGLFLLKEALKQRDELQVSTKYIK